LPGFSVVDNCALAETIAPDVEFVTVQLPLLDVPTPNPSGPEAAGETEASVIDTLPAVATENVKTSDPLGTRDPLNVSVVELLVDVDGELGLPNSWEHADVVRMVRGTRSDNKHRRTVMLVVSDESRFAGYSLPLHELTAQNSEGL
jgi:hypothetical protein